MKRVSILKSRFRLNPIFQDKRQKIEDELPPLVSFQWLDKEEKTIGEFSAPMIGAALLYTAERQIATFVSEWIGREQVVEDTEENNG